MVNNSRRILGVSILVATFFFFASGLRDLITGIDVSGFFVTFVFTFGGYYLGRVLVLQQPFVPDFLKEFIKNLMERR